MHLFKLSENWWWWIIEYSKEVPILVCSFWVGKEKGTAGWVLQNWDCSREHPFGKIFSQLAKQPAKKPMNNQIKQPNKKNPTGKSWGIFSRQKWVKFTTKQVSVDTKYERLQKTGDFFVHLHDKILALI